MQFDGAATGGHPLKKKDGKPSFISLKGAPEGRCPYRE